MTTLTPARPVPPGRLIRREIEERGWTQKELAEIMGRPEQVITEIVHGSKQITPETAQEFAAAFGTSAEVWLNLEGNYRLSLAARETGERTDAITRRARLHSIVPIRQLVQRGWIGAADNLADLERQVRDALGLRSLDVVTMPAVHFRQMQGREIDQGAQLAWLRRVETLARAQKVAPFSRDGLVAHMRDLLAFSARSEDAGKVPGALLELGVHFVVVPHLPHTYVDGAALWIEDRPVVAQSLRHNRVDNFWLTLMHELAHIVAGRSAVYLDEFEDGKDLADSSEEREADAMARNWLLHPRAFADFVHDAGPSFTAAAIKDFARSQHRTDGIVLGRLQCDGLLGYNQHRSLIDKVRPYLEHWNDVSAPVHVREHSMEETIRAPIPVQQNPWGPVWARIVGHAGHQFLTKTGRPFTYAIQGNSVKLNQHNRLIPQSDFAFAFPLMPIPGPGSIRDQVQGSAYLWAILHDPRIAGTPSPSRFPQPHAFVE